MTPILPPAARNWISLTGAVVALISLFMIVFLYAITAVFNQQAAYIGLVIYILLPAFMVLGLVVFVVGMIRQVRKGGKEGREKWPRIDLNDARQRKAFNLFATGTVLFLFISALGSYEAFRFTESNRFCGRLCHSVMEPEYSLHEQSPHARVDCVACHVGPGADWYVRSKLSGLVQVYRTLTDTYSKPIRIPIENLRPPQEICLQCHWPRYFLPDILRHRVYFLADKDNTRWELDLKLKLGRQDTHSRGIHWHTAADVRIEYAAADRELRKISRVRYTDLASGETREYLAPGTEKEASTGELRTMDCLDCHNRPSHRFRSPGEIMNEALDQGKISTGLPQIKKAAVSAWPDSSSSREEGQQSIAGEMRSFYRQRFPGVMTEKDAELEQAISVVQQSFGENAFPGMKADWRDYPDYSTHLIFSGCFRCHDGKHATSTGRAIPADCTLCHLILAQGESGQRKQADFGSSLAFAHPVAIGKSWQSGCTGCHQGLIP